MIGFAEDGGGLARLAAALVEIEALRVEVDRLRLSLGLDRLDDPGEVLGEYGLVVVDECHHLPAVSFENVVRSANVRRWVGLTATPYRRDR